MAFGASADSLSSVGYFIGFVVAFIIIVWLIKRASGGVSSITALQQNGVRGRGLVLASAQLSTGVTVNGRRFEQRDMTIDVEIPGRPPYVARGLFLVPRGQGEGIPGSSLDISVDPSNPDRLTILGPGGFSGPWQWTGSPNSY